jgi:hypothetical protein
MQSTQDGLYSQIAQLDQEKNAALESANQASEREMTA